VLGVRSLGQKKSVHYIYIYIYIYTYISYFYVLQMTFMLNPYEAGLDLTDKDDRKLFTDASKGLKEEIYSMGKERASPHFQS